MFLCLLFIFYQVHLGENINKHQFPPRKDEARSVVEIIYFLACIFCSYKCLRAWTGVLGWTVEQRDCKEMNLSPQLYALGLWIWDEQPVDEVQEALLLLPAHLRVTLAAACWMSHGSWRQYTVATKVIREVKQGGGQNCRCKTGCRSKVEFKLSGSVCVWKRNLLDHQLKTIHQNLCLWFF